MTAEEIVKEIDEILASASKTEIPSISAHAHTARNLAVEIIFLKARLDKLENHGLDTP